MRKQQNQEGEEEEEWRRKILIFHAFFCVDLRSRKILIFHFFFLIWGQPTLVYFTVAGHTQTHPVATRSLLFRETAASPGKTTWKEVTAKLSKRDPKSTAEENAIWGLESVMAEKRKQTREILPHASFCGHVGQHTHWKRHIQWKRARERGRETNTHTRDDARTQRNWEDRRKSGWANTGSDRKQVIMFFVKALFLSLWCWTYVMAVRSVFSLS